MEEIAVAICLLVLAAWLHEVGQEMRRDCLRIWALSEGRHRWRAIAAALGWLGDAGAAACVVAAGLHGVGVLP